MKTKNHPGVYIPPPLIYVAFFFLSLALQNWWHLDRSPLDSEMVRMTGWILIALYLVFFGTSVYRFIRSKNTIVPIKPASSLQTSGIYAITRNPMYLSLLFLYMGLAIFKGNWWTFILIPLLILVVQWYVIRKEEIYLHRAFGSDYEAYRQKVRRWI